MTGTLPEPPATALAGPGTAGVLKAAGPRADNSTVDQPAPVAGDSAMHEAAPPAGAAASLDGTREQFLALLLRQFEGAAFDAYEYARRVRAIEMATSASAMADIVEAPVTSEPTLDPVDMMLLARNSSSPQVRDRRKSYVWLAVIGAFFVVLMIVGMWLVSHAKALQNSGNLGLRGPAPALAAPSGSAGGASAALP